jgi:succinyl-CoA synthetase beta subunit
MNLHEYQAKQLFGEYHIPVPNGIPVDTPHEAVEAAQNLGGDAWVVKAQVHAGGRGKAGGVKLVTSHDELRTIAESLLGSGMATHQTHGRELPINRLLVEQTLEIERELYLGALVDRATESIVFMASSAGGMDIEEVAATTPEKILTVHASPVEGLQAYQCREVAFGLGLEGKQISALTKIMLGLYSLFREKDFSLVEINPLIVTRSGELLALDAKVNIDDNALYRRPKLLEMRDPSQEDAKENEAAKHDLNYITLDGNIGCMVNGAGLAMATMDLIKLQGGDPANFLDVGGGTTSERVAAAFKLILSDEKVKAILVNIFGGIVRCDLIAEGIITAIKEVGVSIPVIVRLEGTNAAQGLEMLDNSGLNITTADDLSEAARQAVVSVQQ